VQQAGSLSAQVEAIDARVQQLRQFRATGTAPGIIVGLVLDAPCEGITTDNEIQQLILQRAQIESRIVDLEDTARQNDIPSGIFRVPAASAQAALNSILTREETRSFLIGRVQKLDEDMTHIQDVIQGMKDVAAARHMTLTPETRFGGGPTADFLQRLAARESALREEAGAAEDEARHFGVPSGSMP
jgi:cation transport regulator ChaC